MSKFFFFGATLAASLLLVYGWWMAGSWPGVLVSALLTPLGLLAVKSKKLPFAPSLAFAFFVFDASAGAWQEFPAALLVFVILLALAAWDLSVFLPRLALAGAQDQPARLERNHLLNLAGVLLLGGASSALALNLTLEFNFELTFVLIILAALGLTLLFMRSRSEDDA